ncbi:MAG: SPFH domain-containing protein, partial [Hasllibacter sp.]
HWDHGFQSPFKSEIYFVATRRFTDQKWGTKNPIMMRDPEFGPVRIRAFGTYAVRVTDPGLFMQEIVGTDGEFTTQEITFQIRNVIVQAFSRIVAGSGIPVLDMAANTQEMGGVLAKAISETIRGYGLELPELYIENISLPPAVEAALDKRTSVGIAGDLNKFSQYSAAEAMTAAAQNPGGAGGGMGAGIGAGLGMAMGGMMMGGQQGPWGQVPQQAAPAAPPPPPVEHVWHIAENGATKGPFSKAKLGRMATDGGLTRDTLVWTAGQDGWQKAGDVDELAQLFTVMPPPPPPPPG